MTNLGHAAFKGLRVLDFSRVIAGPACTQILAEFGAEVIKIENPEGGDDTRKMAGPALGTESFFYLAFNRGKKSVALDTTKPEGREFAVQLAEQADVVVENFRPGVAKRLGIDYATLSARNPRLIYCSVSAYGQHGQLSDRPGYDPVMQAEAGLMAIAGAPDDPPMRHPVFIVDTLTSLHASNAIATALYAREKTGKGQHIELALFDTAIAALADSGMYYLVGGTEPPRSGNAHPIAAPVNLVTAKDGPFFIAVANQRLWQQFCRLIERTDLANDPRFETVATRAQNQPALYETLNAVFAEHSRDYWSKKLRALPAGPVLSVAEALESDAVSARGLVQETDHPSGQLRQFGSIYRFSETPVETGLRPPLLGEHTAEVLREYCNVGPALFAALQETGIVAEAEGSDVRTTGPAAAVPKSNNTRAA